MKPQNQYFLFITLLLTLTTNTVKAQFYPDYSENYFDQVSFWDNYYDSLYVVHENDTTLPDKLPGFSHYMRWKNHWNMYMSNSGSFNEAQDMFEMNDVYKTEIQLSNASNHLSNSNSLIVLPAEWEEIGPKNLSNIKTRIIGTNDWQSVHENNTGNYKSGNHVAKVRKIYKHPIDDSKLYALGGDVVDCGGGVFYSEDGGYNWEVMATDDIHLPKFTALAIKPEGVAPDINEEYIFITHLNGAVYRMKKDEGVWIQCTYSEDQCYPIPACGSVTNIDPDISLPYTNVFYNEIQGKPKAINNELDFAKKDVNSSKYSRMFLSRDNGLFYTDNPDATISISGSNIDNGIEWKNVTDVAGQNSNLYSLIQNISLNNGSATGKHFQVMDFASYEKNGEIVYLTLVQTIEYDANGEYIHQSNFYEYLFKSTDFGSTWYRVGENVTNSPDNRDGYLFTTEMSSLFRPGNIEVEYNDPACFYVVGSNEINRYNIHKFNLVNNTWEQSVNRSMSIAGAGYVDANTFVMDPDNNDNWWIMCNDLDKYESGFPISNFGVIWKDYHPDIRDVLIIEDTMIVATDGGVYRSIIGNNDENIMDISSEGMNMSQSRTLGVAQSPPFYVGSGFWHSGIQVYNPETGEWHWATTGGDGSFGYVSFLDKEIFVAGNQYSVQYVISNYDELNRGLKANYIRASENVYDLYFVIKEDQSINKLKFSNDYENSATIQNFAGIPAHTDIDYPKGFSKIREVPNSPNKVSTLISSHKDDNGVTVDSELRIFEGVANSTPELDLIKYFNLTDLYYNFSGQSITNSTDYVFDPRGNGDFYLILNANPDWASDGRGRIVKYDAANDQFDDYSFPADDNYNPNDNYFPRWMGLTDIEIDRQTGVLYLGTAHGVYYLDEANEMWRKYSANVPMFNTQLGIRHCTGEIFASTGFRGIWKADLIRNENTPTMEWNITENQTWEKRMNLFCTLVVEPGVTLTVKDELFVYGMQKIIVKPGAKLIVDGGTITSNCGGFWHGIEVWGNHDENQTLANQGYLQVRNGATIENAKTAVHLWKPQDWSSTGGIVEAFGSTFKNNWRSVEFMPYHDLNINNVEVNNRGLFSNCEFVWDDDYEDLGGTNLIPAITLYDVFGVRIKGCDFVDDRTYITSFEDRAVGIKSIDASYKVTGRRLDLVNIGDPSYTHHEYDPTDFDISNFVNLQKGVLAMNANSQSVATVDHCKFYNNRVGVWIIGMDNAMVTRNYFLYDNNHPADIVKMNGLIIDEASGFQVEGNKFESTLPAETNDGVIINDSGLENNEVFRNEYDGVYAANMASGVNTNDESEVQIEGLQWLCNDYGNYKYDQLYSTATTIDFGDNKGVRLKQGLPGKPAGNTFSSSFDGNQNEFHFGNADPDETVYYAYSNNAPEVPTEIDGNIIVEIDEDPNQCLTTFGTPIIGVTISRLLKSATKIGLEDDLDGAIASLQAERDSLQYILDSVNTEVLYHIAENLDSTAWSQLHAKFMDASPYLNRDLMITLGSQTQPHYPHHLYKELVLANPEIAQSASFMNFLLKKPEPLPARDYEEVIVKRYETISLRSVRINKIIEASEEVSRISNLLVKDELSDTTQVDWNAFKTLLNDRSDAMKLQQITDLHFGIKDPAKGAFYLDFLIDFKDSLDSSYIKDNLYAYIKVKAYIKDSLLNSNGVIEGLDSVRITELTQLRDVFKNYLGGEQASNLLCFHAGICKKLSLYPSYSSGKMASSIENTEQVTESRKVHEFIIVPNPNEGIFTLQNLTEEKVKDLKVFSLEGRIVQFDTWNENNKTHLSLKNAEKGVYYVQIITENDKRFVEKFVLN